MKLTEQIVELLEIQSPMTLKEIVDHFLTIGYEPPKGVAGVAAMVSQALMHLTRNKAVQREVNATGCNHYFLNRVVKR